MFLFSITYGKSNLSIMAIFPALKVPVFHPLSELWENFFSLTSNAAPRPTLRKSGSTLETQGELIICAEADGLRPLRQMRPTVWHAFSPFEPFAPEN